MPSFILNLGPDVVEQSIKNGWRTYEKCFIGNVLVKDIVNTNENYINFISQKIDAMVSNNFIDNYTLMLLYMIDMFDKEPIVHPITIFPDFVHGRNIQFSAYYVHPGYNRIMICDFRGIEYINAIYFTSREYYPLFIKNMTEINPLEYANKFNNCEIGIYPFAGSLVPQFMFSSSKEDVIHDFNQQSVGEDLKHKQIVLKFRQRLEKRLKMLPANYKSTDIVDFLLERQ